MKLKNIIFFIILLIFLNSCKKDYPKDIPDWLKNKIDSYTKDKKRSCPSAGGLTIDELKNINNDSTLYEFSGICSPCSYSFYDYGGNTYCFFDYVSSTVKPCQNYIKTNYKVSRKIWTDTKCSH